MGKTYKIGTEEQQEYLRKYNTTSKGYGFCEPGIVATDSKDFVAFQVAKSFYQTYPEVFNLAYIAKKTGLKKEEIAKRIKTMYEKNQIMLVFNPAVEIMGWGLYYWVVKLKPTATKEQREALTKWFQENDQICTGYAMEEGGDFDYYNGNHMRNIDNLVCGVLDEFRHQDFIEYVHITPIRRCIRESHVNQFDSLHSYRGYFWSEEQKKKVLEIQKEMDAHDFAIIDAINNTASIGDMFDYDVLAKLSGLDAKEMKEDLCRVVDKEKSMLPMIYFNYMAIGLKMHMFLVSFFPNTPTYRSEEIADELTEMSEFENIFDFGDAQHNLILSAYEDITDIDALRAKIQSYGEVADILEATSHRQFRRWTCRLDGENGYWEECVFTDDIMQDRTKKEGPVCPACKKEEE